jgi:hypothetical protein
MKKITRLKLGLEFHLTVLRDLCFFSNLVYLSNVLFLKAAMNCYFYWVSGGRLDITGILGTHNRNRLLTGSGNGRI